LKEVKLREAEAESQAGITIAEGRRVAAESEGTALRLRADAEAYAIRVRAEAEAFSLRAVADALPDQAELLRTYLALRAAEEISKNMAAGPATKIYLPLDIASLLEALSAIGTGAARRREDAPSRPV